MHGGEGARPAIAVITPTKNRCVLLAEALDSVAAQSLRDWEHIIVDDGSEDGTAEMVAQRSAADGRVRYLRRAGERGGASVCRNQGAEASRAPLLVFLDSDDLLAPPALERRVGFMTRNADLDFVVFQTGVFVKTPGDLGRDMSPQILGDDLLRFLFMETPWQTTAPTWRREAFEKIGRFDDTLPSWQDVELHVRAICAGLTYVRQPQVDHFMRWQFEPTKVSIQQRRSPAHLTAALGTLAKMEAFVRDGPGNDWTRQRALCSSYFFVAEQWVLAGDLRAGLEAWRQARARGLASPGLHAAGAGILRLSAWRPALGERLANKWRGWARMRTNPELVDQ